MLVALAILAVSATLLVTAYSPPKPATSDPVETANGLLLAARTEAILTGDSILIRLRRNAMDVGDRHHTFSTPLQIAPSDADQDVPEVSFVVFHDGTRTGGTVLLASGRLEEPLALVPRGAGI